MSPFNAWPSDEAMRASRVTFRGSAQQRGGVLVCLGTCSSVCCFALCKVWCMQLCLGRHGEQSGRQGADPWSLTDLMLYGAEQVYKRGVAFRQWTGWCLVHAAGSFCPASVPKPFMPRRCSRCEDVGHIHYTGCMHAARGLVEGMRGWRDAGPYHGRIAMPALF